MKMSIIVLTYNQDLNCILLTLKSILNQTFQNYEIIISDDGSHDNHFVEIERFFDKYGFARYVLLPHKTNQGTVKNFLSALEYAKGIYIRGIGAGDLFYREDSLYNLYECMSKNDYEVCFGLVKGYYFNGDGTISFGEHAHPYDIMAYKKNGYKSRIQKNLILYGDHVYGAAICYKKDFLEQYLNQINNVVIYIEDIIQVIAALDGKYIHFCDEYVAWYEMKTGISNCKGSNRSKRVRKDFDSFYELMYSRYSDNRYLKKRKKLQFLYKVEDLYLRTIVRAFFNPDSVRFVLNHILQRVRGCYLPEQKTEGFLDDRNYVKDL